MIMHLSNIFEFKKTDNLEKDKNMILENLYLIVAITEKTNAIGKDNNLLYCLKEDMNFFSKSHLFLKNNKK